MGMTKDTKPRGAKPRGVSPRTLPTGSTSGAAPVWHGSNALEMQPGYPDSTGESDGSITTTLVFAGPYATVAAERPAIGAAIAGLEGVVASTRLVNGRGGKGVLTVSLRKAAPESTPNPEAPESISTRWEIEWVSIEKPLTSNPKLVAQGSGTTQTCIDEVEAWRNSPQQRRRLYQIPVAALAREPDPDADADWVKLEGESLKVAQKIAAGIEAWLEFSPIITRVSTYKVPPVTGACGTIGAPAVNVSGYQYLKNGDNLVQLADGDWQRTETWQGSTAWDTDLYEAAT